MALQETGRTDVMVVCCDEPVFHSKIFPAAYIEQSPYEMGSIAARMIVESVENNTTRHAIINPTLIELQPNKSGIVERLKYFPHDSEIGEPVTAAPSKKEWRRNDSHSMQSFFNMKYNFL